MTDNRVQATGSYDGATNEYSLSISQGNSFFGFDYLKKSDIEHLMSCLECMLACDETEEVQ